MSDQYSGILNEKEIQLCCLLKANFSTKEINMLTRQSLQTIYQRKPQIRQKLSIPEKTLERYIKILRDAGLIEYKGSKKTGGYYIVHDRNASNEGITEGITEGINTANTSKE